MREIKFRTYDTSARIWVYISFNENRQIVPSVENSGFLTEWQQFTGLKDKNGKEIYEGDVIEYIRGGRRRLRVVEWDEGRIGWSNVFENRLDNEIIGNICENPELLKDV
jgi:hypothetical protein